MLRSRDPRRTTGPARAADAPGETIDADVVIVGARVAGAATALCLARAGHRVVLVDRTRHPSDTLSTHAFTRGGVVQLARWGLLDDLHAAGAPAVRDVSFHVGGDVLRRRVAEAAGVDHLVAPRRHVLDPLLVDAAERAGARFVDGTTVRTLRRDDDGRVTGVVGHRDDGTVIELRAPHVVGADGIRSTVARLAGAWVLERQVPESAATYAYVRNLDAVGFELHTAPGSYSGVFQTNDDEFCVWVVCRAEWTHSLRAPHADRDREFRSLLGRCVPELADRVDRARVASSVRGSIHLPNQCVEPAGPGWWLVGDALAHRDPISGHGMTDALRDAELLADALDRHLRCGVDERIAQLGYATRQQRAMRPIFDVTSAMSAFPPVGEFVELQMEYSGLIEDEALELAATGPRPWTVNDLRPSSNGQRDAMLATV